jgi:hypothetical protein
LADTRTDANDLGDGDRGEHLLPNRPQILLRSLLVGLAGFIPVPPLSDYLTESLRRGLLRHVAQARQVDVDDAALDILVAPPEDQRLGTFAKVTGLVAALRPLRWSRRLLGAAVLLQGADESLRTFQQATLLDHYCARHHLGPAIDATRAQALRASMEEVGQTTRREVAGETFQKALSAAGRALSAGTRRLLGSRGSAGAGVNGPGAAEAPEAPLPPEGDAVLVADAASRRLVRDVGLHRYSRRLASAFDRRWKPLKKEPGPRG